MVRNTIFVTFFLIFSFITFTNCQNCENKPELEVVSPIPTEGKNITAPFGYSTNCVDHIWSFTENVEIRIHWLRIDGQSGDFVMISSYLPNIPDPSNIQLDTMMPIGDFKLLSWTIDSEDDKPLTTINVLSTTGSFLYFHGGAGDRDPTHRVGFWIEFLPFEKIIPTVEPTTEKMLPTPDPAEEVFVVRFLSGKHPKDFMTALPDFKSKVAIMASNYSDEKEMDIPDGIGADDIVVPTGDIRYCDEKWPLYNECVEVKFRIAVLDSEGKYAMNKKEIDEMWERYNVDPMEEMGLKSYEPPEGTPDIVPWVWVAAMLGVIAVFSAGLCVVWLKGVTEDIRNDSRPIEQITERNENLVDPNALPFYASVNPIIAEWQERIGNNQEASENYELVEQRRRGQQNDNFGVPHFHQRGNQYLDVPLN